MIKKWRSRLRSSAEATVRRHAARALMSGLVVSAALSGPLSAKADPADPAFGYWLNETGSVIVEVKACDGAPDSACGAIVWLNDPVDAVGAPQRDTANPETALRDRPLCGLQLLGDLEFTRPGRWDDGFIYDFKSGDTYSAWIEASGSNTLKLRRYTGLSLLGASFVWSRQIDDHGGC